MAEDRRADLISHLTELRARLLRTAVYATVTTALAWVFFDPIYNFVTAPIQQAVREAHGIIQRTNPLEGFLVRFEISLVVGLIAAAPLIYYEVWAFVAPGLTRKERRAVRPFVPISGVLFLLGVALAYFITGPSITWLERMSPPGTTAQYRLNETLLLFLKFYLAFGIAFQLPIVLVVLALLGIVNSRLLSARWKEATVGIFVIAAIITPTWDPITMSVCALPMVVLYLATIWVIKLIERARRRAQRAEEALVE